MQSEEFDKKIIEAADHHHPAYDEQAWNRMEKLLDEHLPQKKDDGRRIIFFLLTFLLLGAGTWLFISKPWKENKSIVQTVQAVQPSGSVNDGKNITTNKENTIHEVVAENNKDVKSTGIISKPASNLLTPVNNDHPVSNPLGKQLEDKRITTTSGGGKKITVVPLVVTEKDQHKTGVAITSEVQGNNTVSPVKTDNSNPTIATNAPVTITDKKVDNSLPAGSNKDSPLVKEESKEKPVVAKDSSVTKNKPQRKKNNSFFFTLSAGPDISMLGSNNLGRTRLIAGAGLGYTFKDKVTLRTGFYSGRKVYSASPGEYHPPSEFWTYYPYLQSVNANCKVYEIPVSVSYNFGHSSKQHWFASTGLSSYLMKKETYNYFYKYTATGPTQSREWTLLDQNKHYFSVLNLSGGYQRNIGKNISIMAEPYVKLPITGIGYGKVRLNSGGVLFSVAVKPFGARKVGKIK